MRCTKSRVWLWEATAAAADVGGVVALGVAALLAGALLIGGLSYAGQELLSGN